MYGKLAGMTGTADTEAYEFQEIYGLETVVMPTHRPMVRQDRQDQVFRTAARSTTPSSPTSSDCHARPAGAGRHHVDRELRAAVGPAQTKAKLPHQVLNAKQHAREAEIVAQAGRPKMITIATNMAGRGTDIVLGGNVGKQIDLLMAARGARRRREAARAETLRTEWQALHDQVLAAGGLHIIGTERHESRRIDNQLRGRSGRQGDPGSSRFYLSMDDPLLKIFAGDRLKAIMDRLKLPEGEPIEAGIVTRSIESAQRKVEARNFDIRKQLLEYDDVANDQRKVIYAERNALLDSRRLRRAITDLRHRRVHRAVPHHVPEGAVEEQWDVAGLQKVLESDWQIAVPLTDMLKAADVATTTSSPRS
jgi:preprotein translocase subunit SecA